MFSLRPNCPTVPGGRVHDIHAAAEALYDRGGLKLSSFLISIIQTNRKDRNLVTRDIIPFCILCSFRN